MDAINKIQEEKSTPNTPATAGAFYFSITPVSQSIRLQCLACASSWQQLP